MLKQNTSIQTEQEKLLRPESRAIGTLGSGAFPWQWNGYVIYHHFGGRRSKGRQTTPNMVRFASGDAKL